VLKLRLHVRLHIEQNVRNCGWLLYLPWLLGRFFSK